LIAGAVSVLLIAPFTEHITSLDNFPRGGQDFEISAFLILTLLCLLLLAAICAERVMGALFDGGDWFPFHFWEIPLDLFTCFAFCTAVWTPPKQSREHGAFALPLRI
jgi:hypothetical protein